MSLIVSYIVFRHVEVIEKSEVIQRKKDKKSVLNLGQSRPSPRCIDTVSSSFTALFDRCKRQPDKRDKLALRMRPRSSLHATFKRNSLPWTVSAVMGVPRGCMPESSEPAI